MGEAWPVGLIRARTPSKGTHPADGKIADVHVGDGAFVSIPDPSADTSLEWIARYGMVERVRFAVASILASYSYLLSDEISATEATRRLRIMRRAARELRTPRR